MVLASLAQIPGRQVHLLRVRAVLCVMLIITFRNDGTGTQKVGNYEVTVRINSFELERTRIEGHRRADGWRELVRMLLENKDGVIGG